MLSKHILECLHRDHCQRACTKQHVRAGSVDGKQGCIHSHACVVLGMLRKYNVFSEHSTEIWLWWRHIYTVNRIHLFQAWDGNCIYLLSMEVMALVLTHGALLRKNSLLNLLKPDRTATDRAMMLPQYYTLAQETTLTCSVWFTWNIADMLCLAIWLLLCYSR